MMKTKSQAAAWLLGGLALLLSASPAYSQGPLTPPGVPGPTMRSLDDIYNAADLARANAATAASSVNAARTNWMAVDALNFTISQPGFFQLTKNLTTASSTAYGIVINADNVTLDLNGFTLQGPKSGSQYGIKINAGRNNITLRNGIVRGWGNHGIYKDSEYGQDLTMSAVICDNVRSMDNLRDGFHFDFRSAMLTNCSATSNSGSGFSLTGGSQVVHCSALNNKVDGFIGYQMQIGNCMAAGNGGRGMSVNFSSTVTDCVSSGNGLFGYDAGNGSLVKNCVADLNTSHGIQLAIGSTVSHCVCRSNGISNGGHGGGIFTQGNGNLIEDNNVSNNYYGILVVSGSGNLIVRNTAFSNGGSTSNNYNIASGNSYGPTLTNPGAAFTQSNPWSNFSH